MAVGNEELLADSCLVQKEEEFDVVKALQMAVAGPQRKVKKVSRREPDREEVEELQVLRKIDLDIFEVHELSGGFHVTFSDNFLKALGDDVAEFRELHNKISHFRSNRQEELEESWLERAEEICQQHLDLSYSDLDLLSSAIKDCLRHAREEGNVEEVLEQLQVVFLPRKPVQYDKPEEPRDARFKKLMKIVFARE